MTQQWAAPTRWEDYDFGKNCESYGIWLASYVAADVWYNEQGIALGANFGRSIWLLRSALPEGWQIPTAAQAATWWVDQFMADFDWTQCDFTRIPTMTTACRNYYNQARFLQMHLFDIPSRKCPTETCKAMSRTGNPDLAGIGVFISYVFEAVLVTIFFVAFLIDSGFRKRWHRWDDSTRTNHPAPPVSNADYMMDVFRHGVKAFFESATFLCISMLIAALSVAVETTNHRNSQRENQILPYIFTDFYDVKLALLSSIFCIFPVLILSLINDQRGRRTNFRLFLAVVVYVLCVVLIYISPKAEWDYGMEEKITISCDFRGGSTYWNGLKALKVLVIVLPALWVITWLFVMNPLGLEVLNRRSTLAYWRRWLPIIGGWLSLIMMWTILGCFVDLRTHINVAADGSDETNELAFGQILALFVWAPLLLTISFQFFFGPKETYNGEMTVDWSADLGKGSEEDGDADQPLIREFPLS